MKTKEKMDKMRKKDKMKFLLEIKDKKEAADADFEAQVKRDLENPVQLGFVPRQWPDGSFKNNQGWALCRKVMSKAAIQGWQVVIDPEVKRTCERSAARSASNLNSSFVLSSLARRLRARR
jgi:hypothetical protein